MVNTAECLIAEEFHMLFISWVFFIRERKGGRRGVGRDSLINSRSIRIAEMQKQGQREAQNSWDQRKAIEWTNLFTGKPSSLIALQFALE